MQEKNKGNTKSDQSKRWMEEALLRLMRTQRYDRISIQDITDAAGISRRTFYRNYSSKEEILEGCFLRIWEEYRWMLRQQPDLSLPNIARIFFTVMRGHLDFLTLANRQRLLPFFLPKANELIYPEFEELKGGDMPYPKDTVRYALVFSTGGFMRILIKWLNESERRSPQEMAALMKDILSIYNFAI